jgi:hypothetical protein
LKAEEMIHTKDHKTAYIFDPWHFLGQKRRKLMHESWAALFREHILCALPVHKVAPFFSESMGRPTKELYTALGVLVLQQTLDLTDQDTVAQLAFNLQWHYALDIADERDESKYLCEKTLWNIRNVVIENNLDKYFFEQSTDVLAKVFKVDTSKQRIDSVHIKSNMRRLGRIGIFAKTIHTFLVNLKRQHEGALSTLDQGLVDRYLPEKALGCFSLVKPSEAEKTLESVSGDLFHLVECFKDNPEVSSMYSYRTMLRVLKEHCVIQQEEGGPAELKVKPNREVPSDSLQNPSDPDAAYSGHKGQGYQVQVMETYCTHEDEQEKDKTLNLITHVEVQPACVSDARALIPALESASERGLGPEEVLADCLYGSDDNCNKAGAMGVEIISPAKVSTKEGAVTLSDFHFSQTGKVTSCPQGHVPVIAKHKKTRFAVGFECSHCATCPINQKCPVKPGKNHYYLHYDERAMRVAKRRAVECSAEFKDKYRWRAGIEATMSEYDRTTGVKRLRVRGFAAVRFCATLKAIGVNLMRATVVRKARRAGLEAADASRLLLGALFSVVKEHVKFVWRLARHAFCPSMSSNGPARAFSAL